MNEANRILKIRQKQIEDHKAEITQQASELESKNLTLRKKNNQIIQQRDKLEQMVKERTLELQNAKEKAEESDRLKTSFLANMSHEIRTPLNAIVGFSDIICGREFDAEDQNISREMIKHNCNYLLQLFDDIIDISRIESGQIELFTKPITLKKLFASIDAYIDNELRYNKHLSNKEISIYSHLPPEFEDITIETDEKRLIQIFYNLIDNAIKFSERDSQVTITVWPENSNHVRICVEDSGCGIDSDKLEKIKEPFFQAEMLDTRPKGGLGLGLAICQKILQGHDSKLEIDSIPGKGSKISFKLKAAEQISL